MKYLNKKTGQTIDADNEYLRKMAERLPNRYVLITEGEPPIKPEKELIAEPTTPEPEPEANSTPAKRGRKPKNEE